MTHRIGVIGGDGIGPEVTGAALRVLEATGVDHELTHYDLGAHRYLEDGTVLPDEVMEQWRGLDAAGTKIDFVGHDPVSTLAFLRVSGMAGRETEWLARVAGGSGQVHTSWPGAGGSQPWNEQADSLSGPVTQVEPAAQSVSSAS